MGLPCPGRDRVNERAGMHKHRARVAIVQARSPAGSRTGCPGGLFLPQDLAGLDLCLIVISQNGSHSPVSVESTTATSTALGLWIRHGSQEVCLAPYIWGSNCVFQTI